MQTKLGFLATLVQNGKRLTPMLKATIIQFS